MSKQVIFSDKLTPPPAPLSPAVKYGDLVFVSGQPPYFGDRQVAVGDFDAQMHQVMTNIITLLEQAGSSLDKVIKTTVILTSADNFKRMNELYRTYFKEGNYPARTTICCGMGNPDFLLEIECVAHT